MIAFEILPTQAYLSGRSPKRPSSGNHLLAQETQTGTKCMYKLVTLSCKHGVGWPGADQSLERAEAAICFVQGYARGPHSYAEDTRGSESV